MMVFMLGRKCLTRPAALLYRRDTSSIPDSAEHIHSAAIAKETSLHNINHSVPLLTKEKEATTVTEPLLLGCCDFYVSPGGMSRYVYELNSPVHPTLRELRLDSPSSPYTIEEIYDRQKAEKQYVIRNRDTKDGVFHSELARITIQEIGEAVETVGTGAMTWEASIAAFLYFSARPSLLCGDLIELGCGVGVGGILNSVEPCLSKRKGPLKSMTLTDCNDVVLSYCSRNVRKVHSAFTPSYLPKVKVKNLDWKDFLTDGSLEQLQRYDTIVACDCAYRSNDVQAIGRAMTELLKENETARIHMFGPYNRGALHETVYYLEHELNCAIQKEFVDIDRACLKPGSSSESTVEWHNSDLSACTTTSRSVSKFMHVTIWKPTRRSSSNESWIGDID